MKCVLSVATMLLLAVGQARPTHAQPAPLDLVKQSVEALGGADVLRAIKTLVVKADVKHWEPGQSYSVNGESRFLGDSTLTISVDYGNPIRVRYDWDRAMQYPAVDHLKYSEIRYPTYGAVIDDSGAAAPMSGIRLAENVRRGRHADFHNLLLAALDLPQNLSAIEDQKLDNRSLPAVVFTLGTTKLIFIFDPNTKLPAAVRIRDEDNIWGDSNYDLVPSDWRTVGGGVKHAFMQSYKLNGMEVQRITDREIALNAPLAASTFAIPDAVKAAAKPPATGNVPYQWIIRRLFLGRFVDSDAIYFPSGGSFKLVELGPNVQMVQGGGANNLIVNMKDGLAIFDAPTDEGQSRWVIDAAKAKYPGKPIKYLILTHHHMDHTGGMRAYVAEGATVIVPAPDQAYFEQVVKAPHTLDPDAQQKAMKPANVLAVKDFISIKDETVEINLYNIPNPHVDGFLLAHVVKDNILWVTDLISPRGQISRDPGTVAVGDALRKHNITDATIAGGHGATAKQADIATTLTAN